MSEMWISTLNRTKRSKGTVVESILSKLQHDNKCNYINLSVNKK